MNKKSLSLLVHLAKSDHDLAEEEIRMLQAIGDVGGMSSAVVKKTIEKPQNINDLEDLSPYDKFECICYLVQVMKADNKITDPEIDFSRRIAIQLGFDPQVIRGLFNYLDDDPSLKDKPDALWHMVQDYLE